MFAQELEPWGSPLKNLDYGRQDLEALPRLEVLFC